MIRRRFVALSSNLSISSILMALTWLLVWRSIFSGWVFDDAYIAFRFSDNWATGNGLTWNPGEDPVEGFTSFAWVLIGACIQRFLGIPPHISMFAVSISSWLIIMGVILPRMAETIGLWPGRNTGVSLRLLRILTIGTLLVNPYLGITAFHGLETPLYILLLAAFIDVALKNRTSRNEGALAAISFVSITIRPDALIIILPVWAIRYIYCAYSVKRRSIIGRGLALVLVLGAYSLTKWWWFGYPLPNTFYIKQSGLFPGLDYVKNYLMVLIPLGIFLVVAAGYVGISSLLRDETFVLVLLPVVLFCLAYITMNPTVGQGYRFLIPTLPLITLACWRAYLLMAIKFDRATFMGWKSRLFAVVIVAYSIALCSTVARFGIHMYREYGGLKSYFGAIERTLVPVGYKLHQARALSPPPLLATGDIGAIPYFSRLPTMDIIGLADETVAHEGLTHEYIAERNPDVLILQNLYLSRVSSRYTGVGGSLEGGSPPPTSPLFPEDYSTIRIEINGVFYTLDLDKYREILRAPERAHSGAGSTFQVVTTPSFSSDYMYVTDWDFGGLDHYYVFTRRRYEHVDALMRIIQGR